MGDTSNFELIAAKQRIQELEDLVASLTLLNQALELENTALRQGQSNHRKNEQQSESEVCSACSSQKSESEVCSKCSSQKYAKQLDHTEDMDQPKKAEAANSVWDVCGNDFLGEDMRSLPGEDYFLLGSQITELNKIITCMGLLERSTNGFSQSQGNLVEISSKDSRDEQEAMDFIYTKALLEQQSGLSLEAGQTWETKINDGTCPGNGMQPTEWVKKRKNKKKGDCLGDISHLASRLVALKIMYQGHRYHGFASEASTKLTVEAELLKALEKTKLWNGGRDEAQYSRCGRTDKGVSANGQVVALFLRSCQKNPEKFFPHQKFKMDLNVLGVDRVATAKASRVEETEVASRPGNVEIDYVRVLNRALPQDIRVLGWCPVPHGFHARFSCLSREYKYFFVNDGLDIEAMKAACGRFVGEHDFRNFCKMDAANVHSYRRTILNFDIVSCNERWAGMELWMFRVKGTAFLWHQVRCMVAVLFMIGHGDEAPSVIDELLDVHKTLRKPQYLLAPEAPLVLQSCEFQGLVFKCASGTHRLLCLHIEGLIKEHLLKAAILKEGLDQMSNYGDPELTRLGNHKILGHIPLALRPTEPTYEERISKLSAAGIQL